MAFNAHLNRYKHPRLYLQMQRHCSEWEEDIYINMLYETTHDGKKESNAVAI